MTQLPLWGTEDEFADTLLTLALAAACPLATKESDFDAAAPIDEAQHDSVYLSNDPRESMSREEREAWDGADAYADDVCVPRFGPL